MEKALHNKNKLLTEINSAMHTANYSAKTLNEFLGYKSLKTKMIYTHVANMVA